MGPGVALVAVGGLGRREPAPAADLDLLLLHDGSRGDVAAVADRVWYPVWDAGLRLDHSVRTVDEAVAVAADDLRAALGLLDARHVAGDEVLVDRLVTATRAGWRSATRSRLPLLRAAVEERARAAGEVAFLLEPDLKEGRGGLRDVHALQALAVAQVADPPDERVRRAYSVLLDVRDELHVRLGGAGRRTVDRLLMQEQDAVAAALGHDDADALMTAVSDAARVISYSSDTTWRRVLHPAPRRRLPGRRTPARRPLADDVVEQDGEVVLARDADPGGDPVLVLRVAAAAARAGLPVAPHALERLAASPPLPEPWPAAARDALVSLLGAGPSAVPVLEALDQAGLLVRLLPEWDRVRSRPQRNSYHRFTVDRHLLEAAAAAAALTRQVGRPDLLLLGALLHDVGKGWPGDHTDNGVVVAERIARRLGLDDDDVGLLVGMVRHHLLLPDVATRRDLEDPATAQAVADAVGRPDLLELLRALTRADSLATGPAAWSSWKAGLVDVLAGRAGALLRGAPPAAPEPLSPAQQQLVARGEVGLLAEGAPPDVRVTVTAPDRPGLLSTAAAVLALHRLDVRTASAAAAGDVAVSVFAVTPRFGSPPDWAVVRSELRAALAGDLPVQERLAAREAAYDRPAAAVRAAPPEVRLVDDASATATVVEVRAPDRVGLLSRVTAALARCGLDIRTAHVSTLGADVVDAFYVVGRDGGPVVDGEQRRRVHDEVLAALA